MKREELMIGDWVYNTQNQQNEQVQEIGSSLVMLSYNDLYEYSEIEPIRLTPEILKKNNAHKELLMGEQRHFTYSIDGLQLLAIYDADFSFQINGGAIKIKYVHELQHALRICRIRKEIEL